MFGQFLNILEKNQNNKSRLFNLPLAEDTLSVQFKAGNEQNETRKNEQK